jgi:hypothetical protein
MENDFPAAAVSAACRLCERLYYKTASGAMREYARKSSMFALAPTLPPFSVFRASRNRIAPA